MLCVMPKPRYLCQELNQENARLNGHVLHSTAHIKSTHTSECSGARPMTRTAGYETQSAPRLRLSKSQRWKWGREIVRRPAHGTPWHASLCDMDNTYTIHHCSHSELNNDIYNTHKHSFMRSVQALSYVMSPTSDRSALLFHKTEQPKNTLLYPFYNLYESQFNKSCV